MLASTWFISLCCVFSQQLLCSTAPLTIEITRNDPSTGEIVTTKINMDDSMMQRILREKAESAELQPPVETTIGADVYEEGAYDYYDLDCAVPIMPTITNYETMEKLSVRQTSEQRPSRMHNAMSTVVGGLNGIAMNVAAAGLGVVNFFRPGH